ncbi:MAG: M14 family metallopeptidase [Verrucomicrobiales bacterium]
MVEIERVQAQRLGKNNGCYCGECIDIDAVQLEIDSLALKQGWEADTILDIPGKWIRGYRKSVPNARKRLYLSSGIHGDEPSGPLTILQLMRENLWPDDIDIWLVPCLNPAGFRANSRGNDEGIDLNRDYKSVRAVEVRSHIAWLDRQPNFDVSFILHEDWEANGFYIYEVNSENRFSFAQPILDKVREICPIETSNKVDDWNCEAGIIHPHIKPEERLEWAEAIYIIVQKTPQSYTLETPSDFSLSLRVAAHLKGVQTIFELLHQPGA